MHFQLVKINKITFAVLNDSGGFIGIVQKDNSMGSTMASWIASSWEWDQHSFFDTRKKAIDWLVKQ